MKINDPRFIGILDDEYPVRDGKLHCLAVDTATRVEEESNSGINVVKSALKRHAKLYEFLRAFFSPGLSVISHMTPREAVTRTYSFADVKSKIMVNIGAGVKPVHPELINIDVIPYGNIHVLAEGSKLPFVNDSIDLVICESVIEHVPEPEKVFSEIKRILAPGGFAYISIPFIYPFHASPNDFTRFTRNSLRNHFESFTVQKEGMRAGPMSALQGLLMHLFALVFSFGSYSLYLVLSQIFMVIFSPLKILDIPFALLPYSHEIAADIYIFVQKPKHGSA